MSRPSKAALARRLRELGVTASVNTLRKYPHEQLVGMVEQAERLAAHTAKRESAPMPDAIPLATIAPPIPHLPLVPADYGVTRVHGLEQADTLTRVVALLLMPIVVLRLIAGI